MRAVRHGTETLRPAHQTADAGRETLRLTREGADKEGKRMEERAQALAHRQTMKESKAAEFQQKIAMRRKSLGATEAMIQMALAAKLTDS